MRCLAFVQSVSGGVRQAAHDLARFFVKFAPRAQAAFAATRAFVIELVIHHFIFQQR